MSKLSSVFCPPLSDHSCGVLFQAARLEEVKREEYEQLEAQSVPLRNYLMKHVLPTLTQGLNECCKVRPDDPVDYLVSNVRKNCP